MWLGSVTGNGQTFRSNRGKRRPKPCNVVRCMGGGKHLEGPWPAALRPRRRGRRMGRGWGCAPGAGRRTVGDGGGSCLTPPKDG